ncbi:DUF3307 domain-containing protein [Rhodobacterales bacterium HKCCE2091]|nr:DUF3307 domain-containing protein [Rhodobacterales bacterium HKCCE2091]
MTETFAALLLAHVAADFLLQTNWMAAEKENRHPGALATHIACVAITALAATGTLWHPALLALVIAHLAIDVLKSFLPRGRLWPFMADQGLHLVSLVAVAALAPGIWEDGLWGGHDWLAAAMALAAGAIAATEAGGYAVGFLLAPFGDAETDASLPNGGKLIGRLERGLIFVMVMAGQPGGIGFLIAAKSVLRFEASRDGDRRASEYIIIGTLASFGWAIAVAFATLWLMSALTPIGIPPATP